MPKAIESRNDVFITDQGSRCTSRSRARRVPCGRPEPARAAEARLGRARRRASPDRSGRRRGRAEVGRTAAGGGLPRPTAPRCRRPRPLPRPARSADAWPGRRTRPGRDGPDRGRRGASGVSSARRSAIRTPRCLRRRRPPRRPRRCGLGHVIVDCRIRWPNIHLTGLVSGATRLVPRPRRPPRPPRRSPEPARRCGPPRRRRHPRLTPDEPDALGVAAGRAEVARRSRCG